MTKKRKFDVHVEYILRVLATSEDDALDAVNDLISPLPEEYVSRTLSVDVDDEEAETEPEYNPEDKWDKEEWTEVPESFKDDANGYSEEQIPPESEPLEQDEAPIDSYDYVRDDFNFDAERERKREF